MQDVKTFIQGTALDGRTNVTPIETQLNEFLKANPAYSAKSMSFIVGPRYREAFVIFDVKERQNDYGRDTTKYNKPVSKTSQTLKGEAKLGSSDDGQQKH